MSRTYDGSGIARLLQVQVMEYLSNHVCYQNNVINSGNVINCYQFMLSNVINFGNVINCYQMLSILKMLSIVINLCYQLLSILPKSVSVFGYSRVTREGESKSNYRYLEAQMVLSDLRRKT